MVRKIQTLMKLRPILLFLLCISLFASGYISYKFIGADNIIEEISELLLKRIFNIDIEFSNE